MAFTTLTSTQNAFLHEYLRFSTRTLTQRQARSLYGIRNLSARMSELRQAGLRVNTDQHTADGRRGKYGISTRDVHGSRASLGERT